PMDLHGIAMVAGLHLGVGFKWGVTIFCQDVGHYKFKAFETHHVPRSSPILGALSLARANLLPPPKRIRSSDFVTNLEDHLDESFESSAEIDECIAYVDALRARGIDARVVVEAVDREESEAGTRGSVEVRVERVTNPAIPGDITKPAQEARAVEVTYETFKDLVQRFHVHTEEILVRRVQAIDNVQRDQGYRIIATGQQSAILSERISELERDNMRLRGTLDFAIPSIPYSFVAITETPSHSSSACPSRKRSRFPTTFLSVSSPIPGALSSVRAGLLPPRKRIRSSDSATNLKDYLDEISESSVPRETSLRDNVDVRSGDEPYSEPDIDHEVRDDRVTHLVVLDDIHEPTQDDGAIEVIESIKRDQGYRIVATGHQSDVLTMLNTRSGATMTCEAVNELIARRVAKALKARNDSRNLEPLRKVRTNMKTKMMMIMKVEIEEEMEMRNDLTAYTQRFQELVLLCTRMVSNEEDKVEIFNGGLLDNIQGNVIVDEPTILQDAIRVANNLMDQKLKGYARNAENKRRPGHYRKDCPKLRNHNCGNKTGNKTRNDEATVRAYAIEEGGGANPDSNVIKGTFLLNNCYASMLFDLGANRSFVSSTFSALLDVAPSTLDTSYDVEFVDGRISKTNVILRGCTLGLLGHPFDIDLIPVELGSFDVIIGMDWLASTTL
nr:reverse transcriptase domain-containing protein [Tanacetum cinerariifolium]